jgi:hypothetical protein
MTLTLPLPHFKTTSITLDVFYRIVLLFALKFLYILQIFTTIRIPLALKTLIFNNTKMSSSLAFESILLFHEDIPDLLILEHPLVITHLHYNKRKTSTIILVLPITLKCCRLTKKSRK